MKKVIFVFLIMLVMRTGDAYANSVSCYAILDADTLRIGNNLIERTYIWNGGHVMTAYIMDKQNEEVWVNQSVTPDLYIPKQSQEAKDVSWNVQEVESPVFPKHTELTVEYKLDQLWVKRVFRIYPDCPAIAVDTYLKGTAKGTWMIHKKNPADMKNLESMNILTQQDEIPVLDQVSLQGKHWYIRSLEFFDITDYYNTLVRPYEGLAFNENVNRGNLLFFRNLEKGKGLFFLKEAPCSGVQLAYPGADFITAPGRVKYIGIGLTATDLRPDEWVKAYSAVTGVYAGEQEEPLLALRSYQKNKRTLLDTRDEMVMLNTWGDRGDLSRLNEAFCLHEIEECARLGINYFQLDYGWQKGKDPGSYKNVYTDPDFWTPSKSLFPNGLKPLVDKGKELGVEIGLFINPSFEYSYNDWEKDANSMIRMHKEYGIRTFKVDGVLLTNKLAETRFRKMLDKVLAETNQEAVFNLDVTAGQRGGYFYYNEYGNAFLENRYTDWGNYYPFWTLRNLWMLLKYVPAEKLQIEFLNKWRNQEKYGTDRFAPADYSFDYLFAITMAAQPLAWFDASALPEEAFTTQKLIRQYRTVQHDFHQGVILPIGDEPSGRSWTGFQSLKGDEGYLLVYRERNPASTGSLKTYLKKGSVVEFIPVLGEGKKFSQRISDAGIVTVSLPNENSFAMYKYKIKKYTINY